MNFRDRVMWISCSERVLCRERSQSTTGGRPVNAFVPQGWGGGQGVLRVSSGGDDRMQENIEVEKFLDMGLPTDPHKNPGPTINPPKIPCRISKHYHESSDCFGIAALHVTSRPPCWWSRTKAFLSCLGTYIATGKTVNT